jgi:hypothetical protein
MQHIIQGIIRLAMSWVLWLAGLATVYCIAGGVSAVGFNFRQGLATKEQLAAAKKEIQLSGRTINRDACDKIERKANRKIGFSITLIVAPCIAAFFCPQLIAAVAILIFLWVTGSLGIFFIPGFIPSDSKTE